MEHWKCPIYGRLVCPTCGLCQTCENYRSDFGKSSEHTIHYCKLIRREKIEREGNNIT